MPDRLRPQAITPQGYREFARTLARVIETGRSVRVRGAGTKLGWGGQADPSALQVSTLRLTDHRLTEDHASFGAGTPISAIQRRLARQGRMVALDAPAHAPRGGVGATLGGVIATGDSGPLSHGFGHPRLQLTDLLVALSDGSLVRAAEFAERDLASLFTGSFGSLGAIVEATLETHPLPAHTVTVTGIAYSPDPILNTAQALAESDAAPMALDFAWQGGRGGLLVLLAGEPSSDKVALTQQLAIASGLQDVGIREDHQRLWASQRAGQRSSDQAVVRVSCRRQALAQLLELVDQLGGSAVGRAAVCCVYVTLAPEAVPLLRSRLPLGASTFITDIPAHARTELDAWDRLDPATLRLMSTVRARFAPASRCNSGVYLDV